MIAPASPAICGKLNFKSVLSVVLVQRSAGANCASCLGTRSVYVDILARMRSTTRVSLGDYEQSYEQSVNRDDQVQAKF